jgi:hypothetical protein
MSEENVETGAAGLTTPLRSERQASAVRRQADTHRDVASLAKLLSEVRDDCGHLTAEWWVGLWKLGDGGRPEHVEFEKTMARDQWHKHFGGQSAWIPTSRPPISTR